MNRIVFWGLISLASVLALILAFHLLSWIFLILVSFTISMKKEYKKPSRFYYTIFNFAYWLLCFEGRVKIKASGLEKIPYGTRFLFVSNHRSKFDNMVHSLCMKKEYVAFLSKKENFKIPFGRHYMKRSLYQSLDRGNIRVAAQVILNCIGFIKNDICSVAVFPEGTRSKTTELLPFKDGCFKIATKTRCPIVIAVTKGTENIHKNFPFKRTTVELEILKVMDASEYEGMTTVQISDKIHGMMLKNL